MERIDVFLNGKFGSFIPKKKRRIEGQNIFELNSVQDDIGQPENGTDNLKGIIQRLIDIELRKHRNKQRISIKRTYSDSKIVVLEKTKKRRKQPISFSLMSNLEKNKQTKSCLQKNRSEKTKELAKNVRKLKNATSPDKTVEGFLRNNEPDKAKEVEILRAETETAENLENVDPIPRELKLDSHNTPIPIVDIKDRFVSNNKLCKGKIQKQKDTATQTEHKFLLRIVRSCPVQNKNLTLYVPLHLDQTTKTQKIPKNEGTNDLPDINLSSIIFRKASDNLIYEKRKGSSSPSYISSPHRFRWKYISPTNKREFGD